MAWTAKPARAALLAGTWYPDSTSQCRAMFNQFERDSKAKSSTRTRLSAGIVPHAGWVFSGSIAYNVISELARLAERPDTVVLFAGHLRPSQAPTVMTHGDCWTPFGALETDEVLAQAIAAHTGVRAESPVGHSQDNSAEVEFPLIKHFFPQAKLLIIGAPPHTESLALADTTVAAARRLGRSIVALGSTDLTHYGPNYYFTPRGTGPKARQWVEEVNDPILVDAICQGRSEDLVEIALAHQNACCPGAAAAALRCGEQLGQSGGEIVRYATSADVHPTESFVGYAGVVI